MLKPYFPLAALVLWFSSHTAFSQTWTFDQVLQSALGNHPAVLGKQSAAQAAKAEQDGAEWQRYPTPSIEAGHASGSSASGGGTHTVMRVQQPLWTGGRITAGIAMAERRTDAAEAAVAEARQEIGLKVIAAFTEAERQTARQSAAVDAVKAHEKLLKLIERRVAREVSPSVDLGLARSRLYQASNDLSLAVQGKTNALTQLSQLAGKPVGEIAERATKAASKETAGSGVLDSRETALERAVGHSPVLLRLAFEEAATTDEIDLKRAAYMPQVALRVERSTGGVPSDTRALLVLEAQPGAGLSALSGVDAAVARREAARQSREAALRDVRERVQVDWNEWVGARLRLDNAREARAMSVEVFESYTRQYTTGRKTWIDVLNAVREATQAEAAMADAAAQAAAAGMRLRLLTGDMGAPRDAPPAVEAPLRR